MGFEYTIYFRTKKDAIKIAREILNNNDRKLKVYIGGINSPKSERLNFVVNEDWAKVGLNLSVFKDLSEMKNYLKDDFEQIYFSMSSESLLNSFGLFIEKDRISILVSRVVVKKDWDKLLRTIEELAKIIRPYAIYSSMQYEGFEEIIKNCKPNTFHFYDWDKNELVDLSEKAEKIVEEYLDEKE